MIIYCFKKKINISSPFKEKNLLTIIGHEGKIRQFHRIILQHSTAMNLLDRKFNLKKIKIKNEN